jgi:phosphate acetyltransferase
VNPLATIIDKARAARSHIVLGEGEDPRILDGAVRAVRDGIARITLVGDSAKIDAGLKARGANGTDCLIEDPSTSARKKAYVAHYLALNKHKSLDEEAARQAVSDPLGFAAMMVRSGDADGTLNGAVATTAATVRAALRIIGVAEKSSIVSSFFLMLLCEPHHPKQGVLVFADCGLVIEPTAAELAEIAISSARGFETLTGETARVAMLSFSTNGSAAHERVSKVVEATGLVKRRNPSLLIDGEIQFDAAFVETVSATKSPHSPLRGEANVFIFPNLDAANIGYKIAQRIGGAKAIGPIMQGLAKPANDLSRGCSADDVYHMIAVTAVQAAYAHHETYAIAGH